MKIKKYENLKKRKKNSKYKECKTQRKIKNGKPFIKQNRVYEKRMLDAKKEMEEEKEE